MGNSEFKRKSKDNMKILTWGGTFAVLVSGYFTINSFIQRREIPIPEAYLVYQLKEGELHSLKGINMLYEGFLNDNKGISQCLLEARSELEHKILPLEAEVDSLGQLPEIIDYEKSTGKFDKRSWVALGSLLCTTLGLLFYVGERQKYLRRKYGAYETPNDMGNSGGDIKNNSLFC